MKAVLVLPLEHVGITDIAAVGGKSASLGEMIQNLTASGLRLLVNGAWIHQRHPFTFEINSRISELKAKLTALIKGFYIREKAIGFADIKGELFRKVNVTKSGGIPVRNSGSATVSFGSCCPR